MESRAVRVIHARTSGYIQSIDYASLVTLAEHHDICFRLEYRAGHFVIQGSALITFTPGVDKHEEIEQAALTAFIFGRQRSPIQDIEYMIDQINQVGARAPSLNDPYTAIACVDWSSAGIARLVTLEFPSSRYRGRGGRLRLIADRLTFDGIVNTAFDEFR